MLILFSWQKRAVCDPVKAWRGDNVKSECSLYWSLLLQVIAPSVATWARILFLSINNIDVWSSLIFFPQHWFLILHIFFSPICLPTLEHTITPGGRKCWYETPSISWKLSTSPFQSLASHISKNVMKKRLILSTIRYVGWQRFPIWHLFSTMYSFAAKR